MQYCDTRPRVYYYRAMRQLRVPADGRVSRYNNNSNNTNNDGNGNNDDNNNIIMCDRPTQAVRRRYEAYVQNTVIIIYDLENDDV